MLCYAKNIAMASFNQVAIDKEVLDTFVEKDINGRFRYENFIRARTSWSRKNKPNNWYPIYVSHDLKHITLEPIDGYHEIYPITNQGEFTWKNIPSSFNELNNDNYFKAVFEEGKINIYHKYREQQVFKNFWSQKKYQSEFNGTNLLKNILGVASSFSFPKSIYAVLDSIKIVSGKSDLILDYFAGSGTTAHAVINLNREDGGKRKYILVEQGEYFDTVLKPRVQKVVYAKDWKDGKPVRSSENADPFGGVPQIVKVLKLESYEDTLNNLVLKDNGDLFNRLPENVREDYLLRYLLDDQSKASLLNTDVFRRPFDYQMDIATSSAGASETVKIDLVETFNYLLGLRVASITNKVERYGYLAVEGYSLSGEHILVVWRDCERVRYVDLEDILRRLKVNPRDKEYNLIYINGDHNIATVWESAEGMRTLKLRQTEEAFLNLMFEEGNL